MHVNEKPEDAKQSLIDNPAQAVLSDDTEEEDILLSPLVAEVMGRYRRAKRDRQPTEKIWESSYYNFRGKYKDDHKFVETEKSRAFIKITKTKVQASYGQLLEILLSEGKLPISIEPTKLPEGIAETVHFDPRDPTAEQEKILEKAGEQDPIGFSGDDNPLEPGQTLGDRIGNLTRKLFKGAVPKEGPADEVEEITVDPAMRQAKAMEKKIIDQLQESDAIDHFCKAVFEMVLLGTGVLKGPSLIKKEYPNWTNEGKYDPVIKARPKIEYVSVWDFYPDPGARTADEMEWAFQRHRMTKFDLLALKKRPFFRETPIDEIIEMGSNYKAEWWETSLTEQGRVVSEERFEVIEYWGLIDRHMLVEEMEQDIPEELDGQNEFQVNMWLSGGRILRLVLNPFKPARIPYFISQYEQDPYNFFGVGLPENMSDAQTLMNGFARLAIDNAVLAGNLMIEVDESNLMPGHDMSIYSGKVWRRQGGAPGQAIFGITFPNTGETNMNMFDKFRVLADEATGIPSFSHGQTGVSGVGRTASGISMLLGAASLNTKTIIKNIDRGFLQPLGEAMYAFNMQFDFDPELVGDLEVRAMGTSSLLQREVKTQKMLQFIQISANPFFAAIVNFEYVLRQFAKDLDLEPDKLILNPKKAALQAKLIAMASAAINEGGAGSQASGIAGPQDQTGGGGQNISPGTPTSPGEAQFSGTPGGQGLVPGAGEGSGQQ